MSMKKTIKWLLAWAGVSVFVCGMGASAAPDAPAKEKTGGSKQKTETPAKDGKKDATADAQPADPTGGLQSFCKMLPVGQKNAGVKIPSFTDGVPTSIITSKTMTRLDDENMAMEGMNIKLFDQKSGRSKDLNVRLKTGNYHMPTQLLNSETRSRIERMDFTLDGDSLVFDTTTQQGKLTGNVRMVIFDADTLTGGKPGEEREKEGKAGGTADEPSTQNEKPKADGAIKAGNKKEK